MRTHVRARVHLTAEDHGLLTPWRGLSRGTGPTPSVRPRGAPRAGDAEPRPGRRGTTAPPLVGSLGARERSGGPGIVPASPCPGGGIPLGEGGLGGGPVPLKTRAVAGRVPYGARRRTARPPPRPVARAPETGDRAGAVRPGPVGAGRRN